jgi:hypothetical protein
MRTAITLCLGLALTCTAVARAADDPADKFVGTYLYESAREGDQQLPKDALDGRAVNVTGDTITLIDVDGKEAYVIKYKAEAGDDESRCKLHMQIIKAAMPEAVGSKAGGLIKREGDKVTLIYNPMDESVPVDFEPGDGRHLFVLKRKAG